MCYTHMNIIHERQEKRKSEIIKVREMIKEIIKEEKALIKKELVLAVMSICNLSKRIATDYLEVALYEEGIKI